MSVRMAACAVLFLVVSACGSGSGDSVESEARQASDSTVPSTVLECEAEGFPCSLSEVPIEIVEQSDNLSEEAIDMFAAGASTPEVEAWLNSRDDMVDVEADEQAVRFRIDGGRGTWILRAAAFGARGGPGSAPPSQHVNLPTPAPALHVAGPDKEQKSALVLSPFLWDFGSLDDGALVQGILSDTRGYEGRVTFEANATQTESKVTVEDFKGWEKFQVIHVVTHGTRICTDGSCRAAIAASTLVGTAPEGKGIITAEATLTRLTDRGVDIATVEGARGLDLEPGADPELERIKVILLTAEFFAGQYGGGLDHTLVFFNACETFAGDATDLANALRGTNSVYLGWTDTVSSEAAVAAAEALYEDLSERGYPAEVAYAKLGSLKTDSGFVGAELVLGDVSGSDDLRIRDVVELIDPSSGELLSATSQVPIVGTLGDDEPDSVSYTVQVDGMTPEFAPKTTLHVSIDGVETETQRVSDGTANDKDQWLITGVAPLGFDLKESTTVDFRAWVELHGGGESDDETPATITGNQPLMGFEWVMKATTTVALEGGRANVSTAELTLQFEEGQDVNEPQPRYVVTGGTVTYGDRSGSALGCSYSGGGGSYQVTADMSPATRTDGFASSVLTFDTTVTPVEYRGVIYTEGSIADTVTQTCQLSGANTVSYGSNTSWMIVDQSDHLTVEDRRLITGFVEHASGYTLAFEITRTK